MRAKITRAEGVPGLFDVVLEDGREFRDLTTAQTSNLIGEMALTPMPPMNDVQFPGVAP